jgi:Tol biopolymer transport system component
MAAADGSQAQVLVPTGVASGGVWSPTGDRIAFDAGPSLSSADEIRIIDIASGKLTSLVSARGTGLLHVIRFSPDGHRILFARLDANSVVGTSLWSVNTDGSGARLLVTGTGWGDWQPGSGG